MQHLLFKEFSLNLPQHCISVFTLPEKRNPLGISGPEESLYIHFRAVLKRALQLFIEAIAESFLELEEWMLYQLTSGLPLLGEPGKYSTDKR